MLLVGIVPLWVAADAVIRLRNRRRLGRRSAELVVYAVSTIRVTLLVAAVALFPAEVNMTDTGLGVVVASSRLFFRVDILYAALFCFAAIGLVLDTVVRLVGRLMLRRLAV